MFAFWQRAATTVFPLETLEEVTEASFFYPEFFLLKMVNLPAASHDCDDKRVSSPPLATIC